MVTSMTSVTYSQAREHLAKIWDEIEDAQQPVLLQRRRHQDMALLPAHELASLQEIAYCFARRKTPPDWLRR
jgi:PHD/YefM family antitoxin component YafN of YafNO toxin-antitoxin module